MTTLRIVLAEDHEVMREGLRLLLDREADLEVVGEADAAGLAARELICHTVIVPADQDKPDLNCSPSRYDRIRRYAIRHAWLERGRPASPARRPP